MGSTRIRRRRAVALAALLALAAGAFAFGTTLGDGAAPEGRVPPPESTLPLGRPAGERIGVGLEGTEVAPELRAAIHQGAIAGVVLFAGSFPSRAAGRRLIGRLQAIARPPQLRDPLLIMVDQEGGEVKRVSGAPSVSARE